MAQFLSKDKGTISRWESGQFEPDELTLGVLHRLWLKVFGEYEGPYKIEFETEKPAANPAPQKSKDALEVIGKALLIGGVAFFIAKGLKISKEE